MGITNRFKYVNEMMNSLKDLYAFCNCLLSNGLLKFEMFVNGSQN